MTPRRRPTLALVLGGALFGTLCLSFLGLVLLRRNYQDLLDR